MKFLLRIFATVLCSLIFILPVFAQTSEKDFIDLMREGGKIYVVYLLLGVIVAGILIYLVLLERKVNKLEKTISQKE